MKKSSELIQNKLQQPAMPPTSPDVLEETIRQSKQLLRQNQLAKRTTFIEFFKAQLRFISPKIWGVQLLIVVGMILFVQHTEVSSVRDKLQLLAHASMAAPLLVLAGIQLLTRSFTHNMMEIELSTRHSLEKLMMVRLSILSMADLLGLLASASFFSMQLERDIGLVLLYLFVPFNLTCLGCLWILNRIHTKDSGYYCLAYGGLLVILQFVLSIETVNLYDAPAVGGWLIVLVVSSLAVIYEVRKLREACRTIDQIQPAYLFN
ncbi:hypothetical protein [Paenibacillus donghaensis]|uniref:Uncharacterized protein n=1 Tax=Paenibacillus donghaensis TaxID=414771 RepID=A0A2Z2KL44_9BACL|nr:hypothetical protein [Paenibacillus donghaensis]ASA24120.1 hypothetical protein B9T62_27045 [Paenibacillus donghaensis]